MYSSQNDWWNIKTNSSSVKSLASCGKNYELNIKSKKSLKIAPLYLRLTLHSTNRPQATTHNFWLKKFFLWRLNKWNKRLSPMSISPRHKKSNGRFLYMGRGVAVHGTRLDSVNTPEAYLERFPRSKGCALAVKAPPIKFNPQLKMDLPWFRIHIHFAGPLEGYYNLIVVDIFLKWSEVNRCKNPIKEITLNFLHELFARFGVLNTLVSDIGCQFTSGEVRDFCET